MITNQTKKRVISKKERICSTMWSKSRGLMFRKKQNLVMVFKKEVKAKLHNFFVFYPIDILLLDKNKKIIEIKRNFKPFTFWNSKKKGKYIVELSWRGRYSVGDKLSLDIKTLGIPPLRKMTESSACR